MCIFIRYPTKTFEEPEIIAPESALSPILPTAILFTLTVEEPTFKNLTCGGQGGLGGAGCDTVGAPTTMTFIPFTLTVPFVFDEAIVVVPVQACPVDKLSPTIHTAGIKSLFFYF